MMLILFLVIGICLEIECQGPQPIASQLQLRPYPQIPSYVQSKIIQQQQQQHPQPPPSFAPQRPQPHPHVKQIQSPAPQLPKYVTQNAVNEVVYKPTVSQLPVQSSSKLRPQKSQSIKEELEDYYEDDEPDKLALLLQKSKFDCGAKKDGYYADETLNCEVFHYCQESKKHSWMCPEAMNFHQVHLICMPPSQDNICTKSTNFHFVNDYLYRPINEKEVAATNGSLKYADRYYPQGYTPGMAIDELQEQTPYSPRAPNKFGQNQKVFYNPESVNIPLTQRRPARPSSQSSEYYDD